MPNPTVPKFPKALAAALREAERFAADPRVVGAFHAAADDQRLRRRAMKDAAAYLAERKIELPPALNLQFVDVELGGRPYPLGEFFTIVLTKCRSYWVRERGEGGAPGKWQLVTVCFGLEIFPKHWPPVA